MVGSTIQHSAPVVTASTPTSTLLPTWTWSSSLTQGSTQTYRYKLNDADLSSGSTEVSTASYTPSMPLTAGLHTLYVQEKNNARNWTAAGSFSVLIDTTAPSAPSALFTTDTPTGSDKSSTMLNSLYFRWTESVDAESGIKDYTLTYYNSASCGGDATIVTGLTGTTAQVVGNSGFTYSFKITANNKAGLSTASACSGNIAVYAYSSFSVASTLNGISPVIDQTKKIITYNSLGSGSPIGFSLLNAGVGVTGLSCPNLPTTYATTFRNALITAFGIKSLSGSVEIPCSSDQGSVRFDLNYTATQSAVVSINPTAPFVNAANVQISADQKWVVWDALVGNGYRQIMLKSLLTGVETIISVTADGVTMGEGNSSNPKISADGSFVVFESKAANLGATGGTTSQIIKKSLTNLATAPVVVSVTSDGSSVGNGTSNGPQISVDGSFVVFTSIATNLGSSSSYYQIMKKSLNNLATAPVIVSVTGDGTTLADGNSSNAQISADGTFVIFQSNAANLGNTGGPFTNQLIKKSLTNLATAPIVVSVTNDGTTIGNGSSGHPHLSSDGSYVMFTSNATNLGAGGGQIVKKSLTNLATAPIVVSVTSDGTTIGNGASFNPRISADNSFVLFQSIATNLGTANSVNYQIVRKSLTNLATPPVVVSVTSDGTTNGNGTSQGQQISADGSFALFQSNATNLGSTGGDNIIIKKSLTDLTAAPILVSESSNGTTIGYGYNQTPRISPDGTFVVFEGYGANLGSNGSSSQIIKKSLVNLASAPVVVSVTSDGATLGNGYSYNPRISADGSFILFSSQAANLGATGGAISQIIKKNLTNLATPPVVISTTSDGTTIGNGHSSTPEISIDGSFVVFETRAANLGATGGTYTQIIKKSLSNLATAPVVLSVTNDGVTIGGGYSQYPQISSDGSFIVFTSNAPNLGATGGVNVQIIKKSLTNLATAPVVVSVTSNGTTIGNGASYSPQISADRSFIVFNSNAANLGSTGGVNYQIIKKSLPNLATAPVVLSVTSDGSTIANGTSFTPKISADGSFVVFPSSAANLGAIGGVNVQIIKKSLTNLASAPEVLSVTSDGASIGNGTSQAGTAISQNPQISADGSFVIFQSDAANLGAENGYIQIIMSKIP